MSQERTPLGHPNSTQPAYPDPSNTGRPPAGPPPRSSVVTPDPEPATGPIPAPERPFLEPNTIGPHSGSADGTGIRPSPPPEPSAGPAARRRRPALWLTGITALALTAGAAAGYAESAWQTSGSA